MCPGCAKMTRADAPVILGKAPNLAIFKPHFNVSLGEQVDDYTDWRVKLKERGLVERDRDSNPDRTRSRVREEIDQRDSRQLAEAVAESMKDRGIGPPNDIPPAHDEPMEPARYGPAAPEQKRELQERAGLHMPVSP